MKFGNGRYGVAVVAVILLLATLGCDPATVPTGPKEKQPMPEITLIDPHVKFSFRNHVTAVADPLGGQATVWSGERVSSRVHQMTFVQKTGFFEVPADYRGSLVARLLVRQERRVRIAVVSGTKIRSYYREIPVENQWFDLVLPLEELRGKLEPGDKVDDMTLWLRAAEDAKELKDGSEFYLERIVLRLKR